MNDSTILIKKNETRQFFFFSIFQMVSSLVKYPLDFFYFIFYFFSFNWFVI